MAKCVVFCAVILFLITASIAEDMTPDDSLQALQDQIKNISQATPNIKEAIVLDEEDDYKPEDYEYEDEDEQQDPEKPSNLSPINVLTQLDETKAISQTETPQNTYQTDTITSSETVTKTANINEGKNEDTITVMKTKNANDGDKKEPLSLDTPSENLKESEKKEPLTPMEVSVDFNEKALELEELAVAPLPKMKVQPRIVSRVINITINTEEYHNISSDNFPSPYPEEAVYYEYIVGFGPGFGVEMIVKTIDFEEEDYLLIRPGGNLSSERQVLFSYFLKTEKKYKLLHLDELYIVFETHDKSDPNIHRGFDIDFRRIGEIVTTTTPEPTEPPPVTVAPRNESVLYVSGKSPKQFYDISDIFRLELAAIAGLYCDKYNISIDENITISENVNYHLITRCNIDWPDSSKCVEVRYSIGVHFDDETGAYEMTMEHMDDMWNEFASQMNLTRMGLIVFVPPSDQIFWLWIGISLGVIGIFVVVLLMMWKYRFFYQYVQTPSQRESLVQNRNSNLSLYPMPNQLVPSMYGADTYDDKAWMNTEPPKYSGGGTPSYDGGHENQGYVRNEDSNDLYTDDLIFMSIPEDQKEQSEFGTLAHDDGIDNDESNS